MKRKRFIQLITILPGMSFISSCFRSPQSELIQNPEETDYQPLKILQATNNHGHNHVLIDENEIIIGAGGTFTVTGGGHQHKITIESYQFNDLKNDLAVWVINDDTVSHYHYFQLKYQPKTK
ncbi:MAG: hypothetical protein KDD94_14190 [Calditrichaeota bacterium]|nr:hypothetical protein [Calditrichota bacterium]